jgi:hypothetical protein
LGREEHLDGAGKAVRGSNQSRNIVLTSEGNMRGRRRFLNPLSKWIWDRGLLRVLALDNFPECFGGPV